MGNLKENVVGKKVHIKKVKPKAKEVDKIGETAILAIKDSGAGGRGCVPTN